MQRHRKRPAAPKAEEACFGVVLRGIRKKRGLTQEDLAFESGYHPTYIGHLERGKKSPSLRTIMSLARVLQTRGSEMLRCVEEMVRE